MTSRIIRIPRSRAMNWVTEHSRNLTAEERDALLGVTQKARYLARGQCIFTNSVECMCPIVAAGLREPDSDGDWDARKWGEPLIIFARDWDDWTASYGRDNPESALSGGNRNGAQMRRVVELV